LKPNETEKEPTKEFLLWQIIARSTLCPLTLFRFAGFIIFAPRLHESAFSMVVKAR
jgi:hypothetical protein